jgi:hypothetical protein
MANAAEIVELLTELLAESGVVSDSAPVMQSGQPVYQIAISQPGYIDQIANLNDWIVLGGDVAAVVWPNVKFLATFTANIALVWAPTTVAPVAVAGPGLTATLTFPQPASPNGPWSYSATGPGTVGEFTTDSTGNISAPVTGLTADAECSWTVTVDTQYDGVTATSAASNTITATT